MGSGYYLPVGMLDWKPSLLRGGRVEIHQVKGTQAPWLGVLSLMEANGGPAGGAFLGGLCNSRPWAEANTRILPLAMLTSSL